MYICIFTHVWIFMYICVDIHVYIYVCVCIYMYIYMVVYTYMCVYEYFGITIFTNPSAWAGYDTRSIFKQSLTGLNSEFSFS